MMATHREQAVTDARTVDVSRNGVLLAFGGPTVPFQVGDRCLVSLTLPDGVLHLLGSIRRREVGHDDAHYIGVEFECVSDEDWVCLEAATRLDHGTAKG